MIRFDRSAVLRALFCAVALVLSPACGLVSYGQAAPQAPPAKPDAAPASAQPAPTEGQPDVTLRTNVNEVSLDLVVHDKSKKLITDLKPEDLEVSDNNTPVKLTGLHLVQGDSTRRHIVTMVFDPFVSTAAKDARNVAGKILKVLPSHGYSFAVLDVRGRLRLIQGFTEDRNAVAQAVDTATESNMVKLESTLSRDVNVVTDKADTARSQAVSAAEKNLLSIVRTGADSAGNRADVTQKAYVQSLFTALQESQKSLQEKHGYVNLGAILALVHAQQKLADRKAIVYFTHNMVMDSAAKAMLKTISADSTRAGVTIYIVDMDALNQTGQYQLDNAMLNGRPPFNPAKVVTDPHGDTMTPMQQDSGYGIQGDPSPTGPQWGAKQDIQMMTDFHRAGPVFSPFGDTKSPMAELSADTGGIYIDAQNNLKKPLEQMAQDLATYYEATYTPPIHEYDGSFRSIAVKPVRAGIRVQSKTGYYAVAPGTSEGIRPFEVPLLKSLTADPLPIDVKFRASVLRFGDLPDGNTNTLAVEIPYSSLQVKEDAHTNLFSAQFVIVAQVKDANGAVVEHFGDNITKRGALETLDRDQAGVVSFERHFITTPGKYTLEVAVTDQLSGKTGAQRANFEIANEPNSLALSDMVLVRKLDAVHEDEEDALNPLRYEKDRITPNTSGQLAAGAKGISIFFMLHPLDGAKEPPTLEMEVMRNGNPGRRIPLPLSSGTIQTSIPYLASFGSGSLAPGQYEVKAYLNQGGKTAEQTLSFAVGNGGAAEPNVAGKSSDTGVTAIAAAPEVSIPGQLTITVPRNPVPPISPQEAQQLIDDARDRAVSYRESLPNFMCLEVTSRSVDPDGRGRWKLKDTIVELMRYRDKQESRTTIEINGQASSTSHEAMEGSLSVGEFGGVLKTVFGEKAKARFEWKETDELKGGAVQVYDYTVDQANSEFAVVGPDNREVIAGFHGQVFIDSATRGVRRITLIADLPQKFSTHASSLGVDYDYVAINGHDYLLPVSAEMRLIKGKHEAALNTIEFRNYKRFGSNVRMLGFTPMEQQQN